jgi:signal transduction histidine kinase/DNA-binding response OmpR family regulator
MNNLKKILAIVGLLMGVLSFGVAQNTGLDKELIQMLDEAKKISQSNPKLALQKGEEALAYAQKLKSVEGEARAKQVLARLYVEKGDYVIATQFALASLKIYQGLNQPKDLCTAYLVLGVIYRYQLDYQKSLAYYAQSEAIAVKHKIENLQAAVWGNMGNVYYDMKNYPKAIEYHTKSLEIDKKNNNQQGIGNSLHNIGMVYRSQGNFSRAIDYYKQSLQIDLKEGNQRNIGISYLDFTELYLEIKDYKQALESANKALTIAEETKSKRLESQVLAFLPLIHEHLGNSEVALKYFKKYRQLSDSLQTETISKQIAEMQTRYETEQKEKELSLKNLRIKNQQTSLNQQRILIGGLVTAFLLAVLVAYLLFNRYKLTHKNRQLQLENEQFKLARNLEVREEIDDTINYFATSLYGKNTVEEILWDIVKNCIARLGLVDCVIYLLDDEKKVLVQKAAYGTKNPTDFAIHQPIEIPLGQGIVGSVALKKQAEIVNDTSADSRYIVDEESRLSELAVPLIQQDKVIGVIDSEHPEKDFFKPQHLEALKTIAAICVSKISQAQADAEAQKARQAQIEAEHIKQLDQIKSHFFANISHEFRTPLNLILAPLQKKQYPIPPNEVEMMARNAQRLLKLVNQLLDLAKIEVGLMKLERRNIEVYRFVASIAQSFQPLAEAKNIQYQIDIPERDYVAYFDPDKLEKILYNLLSNAFKFTPHNGKISVYLHIDLPNKLRIAVSDTGIGIPDNQKDKIFERFYQIDSSQTRAYEGTGIGLSLTKELTDLMQGSISLDSQEGKGCTFTVVFPFEKPNEELEIENIDPIQNALNDNYYPELTDNEVITNAFATKTPLVLFVEDNLDLRKYVSGQLSREFTVLEAKTGQEGLDLALEKIPDLVITDIMMPEMDGISLTKALREDDKTSHIPIILLTARDDGESKIKGFETGAEQYLVKPFEMEELFARIKGLLTQRERLRQKFSREVTLQPQEVILNNRDAQFLEKIMVIVEENLMNENFSVEQLQKEIGMSRMQLHRKLTALTNQSASEFIRTIKLKRAAQILQQPGAQVAEAAYLSGFNNLSYFAKCFKEEFGVAPSAYLKKEE